ncbi:MAG TPA: PhzF family phenazine biosynthesis isomerase [Rhizomicrobium sp.]|nr:PhzF family phenazine biosynthesis isomerase [Rhizomicrobium sp.]
MKDVEFLSVFTHAGRGGSPCPLVTDAVGATESDMQGVAKQFGFEAAFVFPSGDADHDFLFRYFVPRHEMEMCGHATIGALWALAREGRLAGDTVRVKTRSGAVTGFVKKFGNDWNVEITQPPGKVIPLNSERTAAVLAALGVGEGSLAGLPVSNAVTSRIKTLVPLRDPDQLNALAPAAADVEAVCNAVGSTGLYPYVVHDAEAQLFEARQFPKSSGYLEDAATGIAATALTFGLLENGLVARDDRVIRVLQGRAMGRLSEIHVRIAFAGDYPAGCLLGGAVSRSSTMPSAGS